MLCFASESVLRLNASSSGAARVDGDERMGLSVRTVRDRVVPARHPFPLYLWGASLSEVRKKKAGGFGYWPFSFAILFLLVPKKKEGQQALVVKSLHFVYTWH